MIDKIQINSSLIGANRLAKDQNSKSAKINKTNSNIDVDYSNLINSTIENNASDQSAVEKARELLLSGELESPENIRLAAENINKFGI